MKKFSMLKDLRTVCFASSPSVNILEEIFGPNGSKIPPNWFERANDASTAIFAYLKKSSSKKNALLFKQVSSIMATLEYALQNNGSLFSVCFEDNTLELQFCFADSKDSCKFEAGLKCYIDDVINNI